MRCNSSWNLILISIHTCIPRRVVTLIASISLVREDVAFFVTRYRGEPAGCGGLKLFGTEYGEIKQMYVRPAYRGLGLGKVMLNRLAEYARERQVSVLRLEPGIYQKEAIGLY